MSRRVGIEQTPDIEAVLAKHLGECGRFGLPCADVRPRDEWCGRCDLRAHVAQALAPVLAAAVREARAAELREAADDLGREWVEDGTHPGLPGCYSAGHERWLRHRADRIAVDAPEGGA